MWACRWKFISICVVSPAHSLAPQQWRIQRLLWVKKPKAEHMCSASSWEPHARSAQVWITQLLPCKYTMQSIPTCHQTAPPWLVVATIWLQLTTHLSTRKDKRLSWPIVSWPTADGLPVAHINGYPSGAGQWPGKVRWSESYTNRGPKNVDAPLAPEIYLCNRQTWTKYNNRKAKAAETRMAPLVLSDPLGRGPKLWRYRDAPSYTMIVESEDPVPHS